MQEDTQELPAVKVSVESSRLIPAVGTTKKPRAYEERFTSGEVTAALTHLYYMEGGQEDMLSIPRTTLAKLFGRSRYAVWRSMRDVESTIDLAVELRKRLTTIVTERRKARLRRAAAAKKRNAEKVLKHSKKPSAKTARNLRDRKKRASTAEERRLAKEERETRREKIMQTKLEKTL